MAWAQFDLREIIDDVEGTETVITEIELGRRFFLPALPASQ
jgi:hypothetical protein